MHLKAVRFRTETFPKTDVYPFNLPFFQAAGGLECPSPIVLLVGENGSGKSTLLEAIARRADIHIWRGFQRSRHEKNLYEDTLHRHLELEWTGKRAPGAFFSSELFKSFSELLDEWASSDPGVLDYFGERSFMTLSHGQGHMAFFRSRFSRPGLYLLDEPETALSPATQIQLLDLLNSLPPETEAQFIIATHSPMLLSLDRATIIDLDSPTLETVDYRETNHFRVYRDFFESIEVRERK